MSRLIIPLCKHCPLDKKCDVAKEIKRHTNNIPMRLSLSLNCSYYKERFEVGDIVKVELKTIEVEPLRYIGNEGDQTGGEWEWKSLGWVTGQIVTVPQSKGKYFVIKLDKKVLLCFPNKGDIYSAEECEVEYYRKVGKDIKFTKSGVVKETEPESVPF